MLNANENFFLPEILQTAIHFCRFGNLEMNWLYCFVFDCCGISIHFQISNQQRRLCFDKLFAFVDAEFAAAVIPSQPNATSPLLPISFELPSQFSSCIIAPTRNARSSLLSSMVRVRFHVCAYRIVLLGDIDTHSYTNTKSEFCGAARRCDGGKTGRGCSGDDRNIVASMSWRGDGGGSLFSRLRGSKRRSLYISFSMSRLVSNDGKVTEDVVVYVHSREKDENATIAQTDSWYVRHSARVCLHLTFQLQPSYQSVMLKKCVLHNFF